MQHKKQINKLLGVGGIIFLQAAIFIPICLYRFIDGDEGYYLYAAKLVMENKIPYLDFFYTQMPLLPYIYGMWFKVFGVTWYSARIFTAIVAMLIGILLYINTKKLSKSRSIGIFSVVLYSFSSWAFGMFTIAKTYALSTLFLLLSYTVIAQSSKNDLKYKYFISGFFLGVAINIRIIFCIVFIAAIFQIFYSINNKLQRKKIVTLFVFGMIVALLPTLLLFIHCPQEFIFGNIGYHFIQNGDSLTRSMIQKISMIFNLLGVLPSSEGVIGFQFSILLILNVTYFIIIIKTKKAIDYSSMVLLLLFAISFLPSPVQNQYFSILLPYLIINSISLIVVLREKNESLHPKVFLNYAKILLLFLSFLYCIVAPICIYRYTSSGFNVPGVHWRNNKANWQISTIRFITREIDANNIDREQVVSSWPGYLLESSSPIMPGFENHFGILVADKLGNDLKNKYHLQSKEDVCNFINKCNFFVLGNYSYEIPVISNKGTILNVGLHFPEKSLISKKLIESGYYCVGKIHNAEFYSNRHIDN